MDFVTTMKQKASTNPKKLVLPEGTEPRIFKAARILLNEKLVSSVILLGNAQVIQQKASLENISLDNIQIIDYMQSPLQEEYIAEYYNLRKHKGLTLPEAKEFMLKPVNWGAMLVRKGVADAMVAGAVTSSAEVLQSALRIIQTAPGTKVASAYFVIHHPNKNLGSDGLFIFADCAAMPDPNAEELAEIAIAAANTCRELFDTEPKVAMLSYSTRGSAKHPTVDKVVQATAIVRQKQPDLLIDGELQLDAAIVPEVAHFKAPGSTIGGNANVLVFPNLNAGNIGYKLAQRLGNAEAYGPFLQGFNKPVSDLSRGCTVDDVVNIAVVTLVKAIRDK